MHSALPFWNQFKARPKKLKKDTGNVLFIILLVVALFAALAYAVTQSTRSGGGDASREQANLDAAEISQYSSAIETSIMRLKISNGCTDDQISFENLIVSGYINPNSPINKSCHVFDPAGGGIAFRKDWIKFLDSAYSTNTDYGVPLFLGLNDFTDTTSSSFPSSSTKDLALFFPFLKKSVCDAINIKIAGFSSSDIAPYEQHAYWRNKWRGDFAEGSGGIIGQWTGGTPLNKFRSGCFRASNTAGIPGYSPPNDFSGEYTYFHVLVPR